MPIPDSRWRWPSAYRERLMDEVCEVSDVLMERYLEGEKISHEEIAAALKQGTNHGKLFPVICGVATRNLGTSRLLDAIVEDLPSPVKHGPLQIGEVELSASEQDELFAYAFKTRADPYAGRVNLVRVYQGVLCHDTQVLQHSLPGRERIGQPIVFSGKGSEHVPEIGPGDMGAVAKLKETHAGRLAGRSRDSALEMPRPKPAGARDGVRRGAEQQGRRGQGVQLAAAAARGRPHDRPASRPADRRADRRRALTDARRSDRRASALSLWRRGHTQASACPLPRDDSSPAKGRGRHKKQTGGRGQFGACQIEIEPLPRAPALSSSISIKGGAIPSQFIPAVEKGVIEAMRPGLSPAIRSRMSASR